MRKRILAVFILPALAFCEEAKPADLTAEQILEKAIEATGGRAVRAKVTTSVMKGDMEIGARNLRGDIEIYSKAPNMRLTVTRVEGMGEMRQGYDGKVAWRKDPAGNVTDITGAQLALAERESILNADLKWKDIYEKVEVAGKGKVENREVWVVKITPKTGRPMVRYFDATSFLLVRSDISMPGGQTEATLKTYLSDYRDVDGIKAPFQITQQSPNGTVGTRFTEIRFNVPVNDAMFTRPPDPAPAVATPAK